MIFDAVKNERHRNSMDALSLTRTNSLCKFLFKKSCFVLLLLIVKGSLKIKMSKYSCRFHLNPTTFYSNLKTNNYNISVNKIIRSSSASAWPTFFSAFRFSSHCFHLRRESARRSPPSTHWCFITRISIQFFRKIKSEQLKRNALGVNCYYSLFPGFLHCFCFCRRLRKRCVFDTV